MEIPNGCDGSGSCGRRRSYKTGPETPFSSAYSGTETPRHELLLPGVDEILDLDDPEVQRRLLDPSLPSGLVVPQMVTNWLKKHRATQTT